MSQIQMKDISQVSHIQDEPVAVASASTALKGHNSQLHVGPKNTIRWATLQHTHGFNTSTLFATFVLKHMQRFVKDFEDAYNQFALTPSSPFRGIQRFQWVSGILQPFNADGQRLPTLTVNTNKAIRMANDSDFFATLTGFDHKPSTVTSEINLDKQTNTVSVGSTNKPGFNELKSRLGFKSFLELGNFVLDQMEEMSRDWEYMYTMIDMTGQLGALSVKALHWGEWGAHCRDLKEACRQAFDLLMGINVDVTQEISYMNLFPASGLSLASVGETVTPENTNANFLQQENSEHFITQTNIPLELPELGSQEVYDASFYNSDQNTFGASHSDMTSCVFTADELEFLSMI